MEPTRIIPISSARSGQPANVIRMDPDPTLIKIETVSGKESISGEIHYVSYYAARLAETLGMHRLEACILEDRDGQTSIAAGQNHGSWHGSIQTSRRSIKQVLESLGR